MPEQLQIIRWEKPPTAPNTRGRYRPRERGYSRYMDIAAALRSHRGQWALIEITDRYSGLAMKIRFGHIACFTPAGDFEAETRRIDGRTHTYARCLGDGGSGNA